MRVQNVLIEEATDCRILPGRLEGRIDLGEPYGLVDVVGLTLPQAGDAIAKQLSMLMKEPAKVEVLQGESRGLQQIRGQHLVRQDGTVSLGEYGAVNVSGLTLSEAKATIEKHLSQFLKEPEVTVDVLGFNSKVYYVILDGGGSGQQVVRLPVVGSETVLDAISQVSGSHGGIGCAFESGFPRSGPDGCSSVLPVDWHALTKQADVRAPTTNCCRATVCLSSRIRWFVLTPPWLASSVLRADIWDHAARFECSPIGLRNRWGNAALALGIMRSSHDDGCERGGRAVA